MKQYLLTPKRAAKRALKEKMAWRQEKPFRTLGFLNRLSRQRVQGPSLLKELYISKHTPKEQAVVFRKINQIIKWITSAEHRRTKIEQVKRERDKAIEEIISLREKEPMFRERNKVGDWKKARERRLLCNSVRKQVREELESLV